VTAIIGQASLLLAFTLSLWGIVAPFLFNRTRKNFSPPGAVFRLQLRGGDKIDDGLLHAPIDEVAKGRQDDDAPDNESSASMHCLPKGPGADKGPARPPPFVVYV